MHATGKDGTEHDPQVCARSELGAHDGTEYRAQTCNVQELNHVGLPCGHGNVIHAVCH